MCQFLEPLKSSNFDPRIYFCHLFFIPLKNEHFLGFDAQNSVPGAPGNPIII